MSLSDDCIIGTKGEILPKKSLREKMGINPGDKVYIEVSPGKMIIRKIFTVEELFNRPIIAHVTPEQFDLEMAEESAAQEERTVKKLNRHIR
jgi:bifunctional DNA-binding transcriptional regulator/antitoxin component of YhaV-PrlF toxin-antitoxin module